MRDPDFRNRHFRSGSEPTSAAIREVLRGAGERVQPAETTRQLVTAPHRAWFDNWRYGQSNPDRYAYVYRIEQLQGIRDCTLLVVGGGNRQLLFDGFDAYAAAANIELVYE